MFERNLDHTIVVVLLYETHFVCCNQHLQMLDLFAQFNTFITVCDSNLSFCRQNVFNFRSRMNIHIFLDSFFKADERLVRDDIKSSGVIYKRIACNARGLLIVFGEAAIDHYKIAFCLYGVLSVDLFNRDMAVDNNCAFRISNPEFIKDSDRKVLGVLLVFICFAFLLVGFAVVNFYTLKSCHLILSEERRIRTAPEIPHQVKLIDLPI